MRGRCLPRRRGTTRRPARLIIRVWGRAIGIPSLSGPPAVKTPAVIATAVAVGLERSRVVKPPFLRTRSALIFVPRSRLNAAPDSLAASSTIERQWRGFDVFVERLCRNSESLAGVRAIEQVHRKV